MINLAESDRSLIEAFDRCIAEHLRSGVAIKFLWIHVLANHGEVHFYPTERADIQHPEDELLGAIVGHTAEIQEWQNGCEFRLPDGTAATARDARERQQIIAAHVARTLFQRASAQDPASVPARIVLHSESGEFETAWETPGLP
ncbi:hypothetical protein [Prosthecobacter sp.]|uniref:hypothetical protein n=1 Tax=Prosthecobacter sp. TaxID=1965333 RepID=UPI003783CB70